MKRISKLCILMVFVLAGGILDQNLQGQESRPAPKDLPEALETLTKSMARFQDIRAQSQTVKDVLAVGSAWMMWLTHAVQEYWESEEGREIKKRNQALIAAGDFEGLAALIKAEAARDDKNGPVWYVGKGGDRRNSLSIISYENVVQLLVPKYIGAVPELDGWGQPYQFAMNSNLRSGSTLGIRSPGKDGTFDTDDYIIGPYDVEDFDRDLVWTDGFFARWPAKRSAPRVDP